MTTTKNPWTRTLKRKSEYHQNRIFVVEPVKISGKPGDDRVDEDIDMEASAKPQDPNDLSAYKLDEYDEEGTSGGLWESTHS
jgi:hypothetical protein